MISEHGGNKVFGKDASYRKDKVKDVIRRHWIEVRDHPERWDEPWDFDEDFNLVRIVSKRSKAGKRRRR